jgi:hypothetical protein
MARDQSPQGSIAVAMRIALGQVALKQRKNIAPRNGPTGQRKTLA